MAFKRLRLLGRRPSEPEDQSPATGRAVDIDAMPLAGATVGSSPVLRPAAIFQQVLYDPAESSPVWARPRPAPASVPTSPALLHNAAVADSAATVEPKPAKGTRRPKASASSGPSRSTSKRNKKTDHDPNVR